MPGQGAPQSLGQALEGRAHSGPQGVAAVRRAFLREQDRADRRLVEAGHVHVPAFAHVLGLVGFLPQLLHRPDLAEPPGETLPLLRGQVLAAEEDDPVLGPRLPHGLVRLAGVLARQVQPADLRADQPARLVHPRQHCHELIVSRDRQALIARVATGKRPCPRCGSTNPVALRACRAAVPPRCGRCVIVWARRATRPVPRDTSATPCTFLQKKTENLAYMEHLGPHRCPKFPQRPESPR
jgi:hypothetical protein